MHTIEPVSSGDTASPAPHTTTARPPTRHCRHTKRRGDRRGRDFRAVFAASFGGWRGDLALVALLVTLAALARWPYLQVLPHFTDEIHEIMAALRVARGEAFPLTAQETYFGPVHYYILGALFRLLGPQLALPRIVIMACGALTVAATYLLGRSLAGRGVGALGAALLATSPQHILINSHIAWQNATMPLYTTLCLAAFVAAANALRSAAGDVVPRRCGPLLTLAGFWFGLALQTHPGVIIITPPLALAYLATIVPDRRWRTLRSPWLPVAALAALSAYSPVLVYNVANRFIGVVRATAQRPYAYEMHPTWESYRTNALNFALQTARMISDPTRLPATPGAYLTSPQIVVAASLAVGGLVLLARRGQPLPLLIVAAAQLVLPRFLRAYGLEDDYPMIAARYVAYLLPLGYLGMAAAAVSLIRLALRRVPAGGDTGSARLHPLDALARFTLATLLALLVLSPLLTLQRYYAATAPNDPNNVAAFALRHDLVAAHPGRTPVLIDNALDKVATKEGVTARDVAVFLLQFQGVPYRLVPNMSEALATVAPGADPAGTVDLPLAIMARDTCWPLRDRFPLQRQGDRLRLQNFYRGLPTYFALYRLTPGAADAGCFGPEGPRAGD